MLKGTAFALVSATVIIMGLIAVTTIPYAVQNQQKEALPMEINYEQRVKLENAGVPSYIQIPSLGSYADIDEVKPDNTGKLQRPQNDSHVGWYGKENRLGKKGVIVIAGDFDTLLGNAGSFYHLAALKKDDIIQVTDLNGERYEYKVVDKGLYNWDAENVESLFTDPVNPRIDLILYPAHAEENKHKPASRTMIYAEMK